MTRNYDKKEILLSMMPRLSCTSNPKLSNKSTENFSFYFDKEFIGHAIVKFNNKSLIIDIFEPFGLHKNKFKGLGLGAYSYLLLLEQLSKRFSKYELLFNSDLISSEAKNMLLSFNLIDEDFLHANSSFSINLKTFYK